VAPSADSETLRKQGADWITFTSASTVEHFHARFDLLELRQRFPRLKLASIGPETTKALSALNLDPTVEAKDHTLDGLVTALTKHFKKADRDRLAG
jgi:uroporphyrinogen III methyltransferase/synthase